MSPGVQMCDVTHVIVQLLFCPLYQTYLYLSKELCYLGYLQCISKQYSHNRHSSSSSKGQNQAKQYEKGIKGCWKLELKKKS